MKLEKQHMIKMRNSNKMMAILKKKHTCLRNNNNNSPLGPKSLPAMLVSHMEFSLSPNILFPIQLLANACGKATKDGPSPWALTYKWKTRKKLLDPDFKLASWCGPCDHLWGYTTGWKIYFSFFLSFLLCK